MTAVRLTRATPADVSAIMAVERGPGFEDLVGRRPADKHWLQRHSRDTKR